MGLTISQNIIKEMGGEIQVRSTPEQGSVFWFYLTLPIVENNRTSEPVSTQSRLPIAMHGESKQILIVDDDRDSRSLLTSLFTPLDFTVWEVGNGELGITLAQQHQPDIIIFDYSLPGINGSEMIAQIKQKLSRPKTLFICTSASNLTENEQVGDTFLPKPINLKKLLILLSTHLDIKWVYPEQLSQPQRQENALASDIKNSTMPPMNELTSFLALIKQGNIWELQKQARQLGETQPQYLEFTEYLRELTENFQLKKLRQFIQNAIDKS